MLETQPKRTAAHPSLAILAAAAATESDGIHAYTRRLVSTLEREGEIEVRWHDARQTLDELCASGSARDGRAPTFLLQYNPFNFGRWGFAPWLPAKLWRLKRSSGARIALMVHETYSPIRDWRSLVMGGWQRVQLFAVRVLADVLFVSTGRWTTVLARHRPRRPVHHLPVASNLPDMRSARRSQRERIGARTDTLVLAAFGTGHTSRLMDYVAHAVDRVAATHADVILLNLGAGSPTVDTAPPVRVIAPGELGEEDVARYLAAADLYLSPLRDGVSTRRGTLMAAMQHGLPIVGTDAHNTDQVLRAATDALWLTPVGDREAFAAAVCELAADGAARAERGTRARALYEREFDWTVISQRLLSELFR